MTETQIKLFESWDILNARIKAVETANLQNVNQRIQSLMEARAKFEEELINSAK